LDDLLTKMVLIWGSLAVELPTVMACPKHCAPWEPFSIGKRRFSARNDALQCESELAFLYFVGFFKIPEIT
jgi:hypothetical protein